MKNIIIFLLACLSFVGVSQTRYTSLSDACTKNQSGSGVTNNSRQVFTENGTTNIGQYLFKSAVLRDKKTVRSGFYFYNNTALETNKYGEITNTQTCSSGSNPNQIFEQTQLQGLIDGSTDVSVNQLNLSVFPTTPPTTNNFYVNHIAGSAVEYLNTDLTNFPYATGFGHNKIRTFAQRPKNKRSHWLVYHYPTAQPQDFAGLGTFEGQNLYNNHFKDKNNSLGKIEWFMGDTETSEWNATTITSFVNALYNQAKTNDADFKYVLYGRALTAQFPTYNAQGDQNYVFPKQNPTLVAQHKTSNGVVNSTYANKDIYADATTYGKVPQPLQTPVYQSNGSGGFLLDGNGNRLYRTSQFQETYRGVTVNFELACPSCPADVASGERYRNVVPAWHIGMYQHYIIYARMVTALQSMSGNDDISNVHATMPYKLMNVQRLTFEANTWTAQDRPLDKYTSQTISYLSTIMARNLWWWDAFAYSTGFTDDGSNFCQAVNEGNPVNTVEGQKNYHNGPFRQASAIMYQNMMRNRDYGFCKKTTKLLAFTDYTLIDSKREILGFGELEGSNARIILAYPITEQGENTTVTIGNTVTSQTYTVTLGSREVKEGVYEFPGAGNLNTNQVWIRYTSIKGQVLKHSGNLTNHDLPL